MCALRKFRDCQQGPQINRNIEKPYIHRGTSVLYPRHLTEIKINNNTKNERATVSISRNTVRAYTIVQFSFCFFFFYFPSHLFPRVVHRYPRWPDTPEFIIHFNLKRFFGRRARVPPSQTAAEILYCCDFQTKSWVYQYSFKFVTVAQETHSDRIFSVHDATLRRLRSR